MRFRVLGAGVLLPLILWAASPLVSHGQGPTGRAASIQKKIEITQWKLGRRKGTERVLTSDIAAYSARIRGLQARIGTLQSREARVQADLDAKRAQLQKTQAELRYQRARLARLRARLAVARDVLARRLVELYEADKPDLVTVVLNAKGFADLIERQDFFARIGEQDRAIVTAVKSARVDAKDATQRLGTLEDRQAQITQIVQSRRDELARLKQGLIGTRVGFERTKAGKQAALSHVRVQREHLEGNLSDLRAEQAKITAALQSGPSLPAGTIRRGSGAFIWPVNGPITSQFCERRAWEACHPGIDIGVPTGTPIRAAAAGVVSLMQPESASGGYGNFTCISHSSSLATCYAHQSRFATSMGAHVSQGQVIGYTGCTGLCFGPHLHFEVRVNGSVVNPMNYL